jgi:SAM-dependent MidA family methyltransferase
MIDNGLSHQLRQRIRNNGPITFRDWMAEALYDAALGYYCRTGGLRWGRAGDYRTSPEISRFFGATFARYFAGLYAKLGSPKQWTITEAGCGSGVFARVLLETLCKRFPNIASATTYVLNERSSASLELARAELAEFSGQTQFHVTEALPTIDPGILFANELIDAFPIHRVIQREGQLAEFYVDVDKKGRFVWRLGTVSTDRLRRYFQASGIELAEGQIAEVNVEAEEWLQLASKKLKRGFLVLVDYGSEASHLYEPSLRREGSLRAIRRHAFVEDPLANPGEQDITTTIDWTFVKTVSEQLGFRIVDFQRQDQFLLNAGILEELESGVEETDDEIERIKLRTEAREMLPGGMSESFQVLVLEKP